MPATTTLGNDDSLVRFNEVSDKLVGIGITDERSWWYLNRKMIAIGARFVR